MSYIKIIFIIKYIDVEGIKRKMSKQLVIQLARLGDIVQTKRLMLSLQSEGSLTLLVDINLVIFAQKIYPYAKIFGVHINQSDPNIIFKENLATFSLLIKENFDIVYSLNHSSFSRQICTLFAPDRLKGYSRFGVHARHSRWVSLAFRWMKDRRYTPLNLMDYWANFSPNPIAPELVNPIAKAGGKGIGIVLSGQNPRRSLSPKDYAKVIHAVYEREKNRLGTDTLFFFGTESESTFADELFFALPSKMQDKVQNLAGKTTLEGLLDRITGLDLLLSPDTGIAHVAAHLGVPVEAFYLSSAHCFETGPYGLGHVVWQASMENITQKIDDKEQKISVCCSPCMEFQDCPYDPKPSRCVQDVSLLPCHKAFQTSAFFMRLDEKKYTQSALEKQILENIVCYHSSFQENESKVEQGIGEVFNENCSENKNISIGLTWQGKQHASHKKRRERLRALLNAYCLATKTNITNNAILARKHSPVFFDQDLYNEVDWVFPPILP